MIASDVFAPELADGTYLLQAALASGMNVELLPRQIMTCWQPSAPDDRRSFVHGIPEASTLAGVTYAQDKRVVRALLQRAGVTNTKGATFSFRGRGAALRYADRLGYPLSVRMAIDDSIRTPPRMAANRAELEAAIDDLRRIRDDSLASATNLRRSAYSLTGLLDPETDENGVRLLARATRVLIEQVPDHPRLHVLVSGDDVLAAAELPPGDHSGAALPQAVAGPLPEAQHEAAVRAAAAVPGLRVAHVVLLTRRPSRLRRRGPYLVHDVSERLGLDLFERARQGWAAELASRLLAQECPRADEAAPTEPITLSVRCEGVDDTAHFSSALPAETTIRFHDPVEGHLHCVVSGTIRELARLLMELSTVGVDGRRSMFLAVEREAAARGDIGE